MSSLGLTEMRAVAGVVMRQRVMDVVRGATFIGTLLLAWISLKPFEELEGLNFGETGTVGNEFTTYALFGCLAIFTVILAMRDNHRALASLITPAFMLFGVWAFITVLMSVDPGTSVRRFSLTLAVIAVAASLMLLPRTPQELTRWLSIAALVLLAVCYLGILLAPRVSIHLATDPLEPQLAGDWRGTFGHKNLAAAVMAMVLFIGIYVFRTGAWLSGAAIIVLSSVFLSHSAGKSSLGLCLAVLIISTIASVIRSFWFRVILLLTPLIVLNAVSVGAVMSDTLAMLAKLLPLDSSFTGRNDIWTFGVQSVQLHPIKGFGFSAFWGRGGIQDLPEGKEWAAFAAHSHNGYLDTALSMGIPGVALLLFAFVIAPLRNFHRADLTNGQRPLVLALMQIWLFGIYLSSLESFYLDRADPIWVTFLMAVFGLHYLARFSVDDDRVATR